MIDLSIKIKDENRTLQEKECVGLEYLISANNPDLLAKIAKVYEKFKSEGDVEAPTIIVKTAFVIQK